MQGRRGEARHFMSESQEAEQRWRMAGRVAAVGGPAGGAWRRESPRPSFYGRCVCKGELLLARAEGERKRPNRYDLPVAVGNLHQKLVLTVMEAGVDLLHKLHYQKQLRWQNLLRK